MRLADDANTASRQDEDARFADALPLFALVLKQPRGLSSHTDRMERPGE